MSDHRAEGRSAHFAAVVQALLEVGSTALRVHLADEPERTRSLDEDLKRLVQTIERYLGSTSIEYPHPGTAPKLSVPTWPFATARTFDGLPKTLQQELITHAPGRRLSVPTQMPRESDEEVRQRYWELRRKGIGRIRACEQIARLSGHSWTRIRDIVNGRDERRRRRMKEPPK